MSHLLIIVTADNCPACVNFKKSILPSLKNDIKKLGLEYEHHDLKTMSESNTLPDYCKELVQWFPTLALEVDDGTFADYYVFNGIAKGGKIHPDRKYNGDLKGINEWLSNMLNKSSTVVVDKKSNTIYTNNLQLI